MMDRLFRLALAVLLVFAACNGGRTTPRDPGPPTLRLVRSGGKCLQDADCQSNVCAGRGCSDDQPGRCMNLGRERSCKDEDMSRYFCSCTGLTFSVIDPVPCATFRFAHTGPCQDGAAP